MIYESRILVRFIAALPAPPTPDVGSPQALKHIQLECVV